MLRHTPKDLCSRALCWLHCRHMRPALLLLLLSFFIVFLQTTTNYKTNKQTNKQTTTTKIKNKNKRRVGKRLNRDTERHRQMHSRSLCTHIHNAHRDRTHATHTHARTHARTHAESIKMTECIKEKQLSRVSNFSPQFRTISKSPKTFLQSQMGESGLIRS